MDEHCIKIIKSRVWSFHRSTGISFDELESEALEAYVKALASYDETNGTAFTTYLYNGVTQKLIQFCRDWHDMLPAIYLEDCKKENESNSLSEIIPHTNDLTQEKMIFEQWKTKLTPKAQGVLEILDLCADELIGYVGKATKNPHSPKLLKGALMRYLLKLNWKESDINRTFLEIERKLVTL